MLLPNLEIRFIACMQRGKVKQSGMRFTCVSYLLVIYFHYHLSSVLVLYTENFLCTCMKIITGKGESTDSWSCP